MSQEIKLPPLPAMSTGALKNAFEEYARAAVELDRQGRGEAVLWCMHILGPDEVHAAPSRAHAETAVKLFNERFGEIAEAKDVMCEAVVVPWPHSADAHANYVGSFITDWIAPQPTAPVVKESLTVAEPVKEVSVPDAIYLGCARMGLAEASDEEVLNYVHIATQRAAAPTPPADGQETAADIPVPESRYKGGQPFFGFDAEDGQTQQDADTAGTAADEAHDRDNYLCVQHDQEQRNAADAERYRWLRDRNDWYAEPRLDEHDGTVWKLTMYTPARIEDPTDDDSLDTAIDAALTQQEGK